MMKPRVLVLGMMGRCPFGGQTWLYLNWLLGLHKLGYDVWYVEDDSVWPYDPIANSCTDDCSYAVQHIASCMERIGLAERWVYRLADRKGACWGLTEAGLADLYNSADMLLNVVGAVDLREEHLVVPARIYVQCDPVTCELRLAVGDAHTRQAFERHTQVFTYGENYGAPDCGVPLNGLHYRKTRQPLDLELWPYCFTPNARYFTTIGNYRQKGSDVVYNGDTFHWSKHHEWEKILGLPQRTAQAFQLAMMPDDSDDRKLLAAHGWNLVPPLEMSMDIFGAYPAYIQNSRGELTVAKDQNVRLRSGWFSERAVCYLASGKPVITQETGFSNILPTGEGLFSFSDMNDIFAALDAINSDYERHCKAAREISEEYFDAKKIVQQLLSEVGA